MKLVWSGRFTRAVKKFARRNPARVEELEIHLLSVGTHDEVY